MAVGEINASARGALLFGEREEEAIAVGLGAHLVEPAIVGSTAESAVHGGVRLRRRHQLSWRAPLCRYTIRPSFEPFAQHWTTCARLSPKRCPPFPSLQYRVFPRLDSLPQH
jgi:hypothetical protein